MTSEPDEPNLVGSLINPYQQKITLNMTLHATGIIAD